MNAVILLGYASTTQVTKLSYEIQDLNKQITQINTHVEELRSDLIHTKHELDRANKRLDNQISFYRK